jgi:predicted Holliday junction resolvase-like endonuclease
MGIELILVIFPLVIVLAIFIGLFFREVIRNQKLKETQRAVIDDAIRRSRSTIEGQTYEQICTLLPQWKCGTPSDARFLGSPIDYVVFKGLSNNCVEEIIFVEVKTGSSKSTKRQNSVKNAVRNGKVKFELLELDKNAS